MGSLGEMSCKTDIASISKEFKLISEGGSHKLEIRNTIISSGDMERKASFEKDVLERLTKSRSHLIQCQYRMTSRQNTSA